MDVQQPASGPPLANVVNSCPALCSLEYGSTDSSPVGDNGSCSRDDAEEYVQDTGSREVANTDSAAVTSTGRSSPDLTCPICLGRLENRSYTDTCFHKFCFVCLVEWSKVKPVCPLCKQPFTSVIHNVQSYENFEQLPVTPAGSETPGILDSNRSRFRYPTTMVHGQSERRRQRELLQRPSRQRRRGSSRFDVPPPAFTSSYRRSIYRDELWVRHVDDSGRYRDTSAVFFAQNQASVHRLMPWLNRELMALLRNPADVAFLLEVILSTVQRIDITSETFYDLVSPFLGARTRHFIHEFYTFARSPFNMEAYDTRAIYERRRQVASTSPIEFSDTSESDPSDSEIVEINPPTTARQSEVQLVPDEHAVNVEDSRRNEPSPQPGPSHLQDSPLLPVQSYRREVLAVPLWPNAGENNCIPNMDDEDSDDGIEIIAEDKPWRERSPVVLSSSDSEGDTVTDPVHLASTSSSAAGTQLSVEAHDGEFAHIVNSGDSQKGDDTLDPSDLDATTARLTESCYAEGSEQSSHRSHHSKREKKHKRKCHGDSPRRHHSHKSHSSPADRHKRRKRRNEVSNDHSKSFSESRHEVSSSVDLLERAEESVWMSDDNSDTDSNRVRSVVVVPHTFKKNSSGHKRSTRDQS